MNLRNLLLNFILLNSIFAFCQNENEVIQPILLDKSVLSGIGLNKIELKNEPERAFFQKRLFRGEDIGVYVVSSQSWTSTFDKFWFDEFVYLFNGQSKVTSGGQVDYFHSGEYFFAPKGFEGSWEVQIGDQVHYELSVITNKRADSTQTSKLKHPFIYDKSKLSGVEITFDENGIYEETLAKGVELEVVLSAAKTGIKQEVKIQKDQLVCLLTGMMKLSDASGKVHQFYAGDFFVLPKNFSGFWENKGHGFSKFLLVSAVD